MPPTLKTSPESSHQQPQKGEYFNGMPVILEKFSTLIERLPVFGHPTRQSVSFGFFPRSKGELSYPDAVEDYMLTNDLVGLAIDITQEGCGTPTTSFEFLFENGMGSRESIYASRSFVDADGESWSHKFENTPDLPYKPIEGSTDTDALITTTSDSPKAIPKIHNNQLNAFIFSLTENYTEAMLALDDPYGHNIVDATTMTASLEKSAIDYTSDYSFWLDDNGTRALDYRITKNGDKDSLNGLTFRYETGSARTISVTVSQDRGFAFDFHTSDADLGVNDHYPDEGDYIRLAEILDEEIAKLKD